MDQGLGLLPLGASGEPGPHSLGGGRWQGPLPLFLSGFEAWLWVAARMLVEDQLWTLDQWENGPQWLDRSLAPVFDLIEPPPLFGGEGSKVLSCKECMRPPNICFLSPPPCLPSLIWPKFQRVGSLGHSQWRALLFISLLMMQGILASLPPTGSGILPSAKRSARGPTLPVYSPEPLLPEAGQAGVGTH